VAQELDHTLRDAGAAHDGVATGLVVQQPQHGADDLQQHVCVRNLFSKEIAQQRGEARGGHHARSVCVEGEGC
jgi:hypothetical protein